MVIRLDMLDVSFVVSSKLQHVYTVSTNAYVISPLCKWFGLEAKIIMLRFVSEEITEMAEIKKKSPIIIRWQATGLHHGVLIGYISYSKSYNLVQKARKRPWERGDFAWLRFKVIQQHWGTRKNEYACLCCFLPPWNHLEVHSSNRKKTTITHNNFRHCCV